MQDSPPGSVDRAGPAADEHRSAELGAVLVGLILLQGMTLINVGGMSFLHIFIGLAILGTVLVKLISVGRRFVRYYAGRADYRAAGPPPVLSRVTAPFLVLATAALLGTGITILVSFGDPGVVRVHRVCFWIWLGLLSVHLAVYLPKLRGILSDDADRQD
jgi:hypothetical protein